MLTTQNIEAELSYAYLHAVATHAGFSCTYSDRHLDGAGIDAIVREDGRRLAPDSILTAIDLHVQLKATYHAPVEQSGKFSYSLSVSHYNKLRNPHVANPRLLVVLYLPENAEDWLHHSEDGLLSKRCAYWVCLRNAPGSVNSTTQTVYIPRRQQLSPQSLTSLMTRLSRRDEVNYDG
jgi:hypothetical protein